MHLVFALFMAVSISGQLSLIFVVAIVFLVVVLAIIMSSTFNIFDRVFKKYDDLNASRAGERLRHPRGQELCARGL